MNEETAIGVRMKHAEIRLDKHEDVHQRLYDGLDRIQKRPPVWATAVIGVLLAICGWLLSLAVM